MSKKKDKLYINTKNICLFSSELASVIGFNPYKGPGETIKRIWSLNFKEDYLNIKNKCQNEKKEENKKEKFKRISTKYKKKTPKLKKNLEQCLKCDNISSLMERMCRYGFQR